MLLIFNDIAKVVLIVAILPRGTVLGDAPSCIVLGQMVIWASRRCSFTSVMPCPIIVANIRFPLRNAG
jgi:hypothetical protein